jgi:hypothetical protein
MTLIEPVFRRQMSHLTCRAPHEPIYEKGCRQNADEGDIVLDSCIASGSKLLQDGPRRSGIEHAVPLYSCWGQCVFADFLFRRSDGVSQPY